MKTKQYHIHCVQTWRIPYTLLIDAENKEKALELAKEQSKDEPFDWNDASLTDTELSILSETD